MYFDALLRPCHRVHARVITAWLHHKRKSCQNGLHLGCGGIYIPELTNADYYDGRVRDVALNVEDLHQYTKDSVDWIETHHVLEHLSRTAAVRALREWYRVLRPGGYLVVTCPDLDAVVHRWTRSSYEERYGPSKQSTIIEMLYGSQENDGMFHRSGWTQRHLRVTLNTVGFRVRYIHYPYPLRQTPSMIVIARK